jgi:hypothetical protein
MAHDLLYLTIMRTTFKSLAIACCLAAGFGCKADKPDQPAASKDDPAPTPTEQGKGRSGKIDLGARHPSLPSDDGSADEGSDRENRRKARMAAIDTDGDGKISDEERAAARKVRAEQMLKRLDTNGDGKVTTEELAASSMRRFDPATVDTNKDGEISVDELAKAMEQRGAGRQWGGRRGGNGGGGPDATAPTPTPPTTP